MKKILLFHIFLLFFNNNLQAKQNKSYQEIIFDKIREIVWSDLEKFNDNISNYSINFIGDSINVIYFRETVIIYFISDEYSEMITHYSLENEGINEKFTNRKTVQNLKLIDRAMQKENKILHDLFDCFIYKYSIRYEEAHGLEVEYRIKADENGMRIIGKKVSVVLVEYK